MQLKTFTRSFSRSKLIKTWGKIAFIVSGIGATIWFLIRVIPKPSRATYPCMKAAAPIMSSFVIYIISLGAIPLLFRKTILNFKKAKYWSALGAIALSFVFLVVFNLNDAPNTYANNLANSVQDLDETPNTPIGQGKGIFPGRVVWVMDKDATNENCSNKSNDYWFMDQNTNQTVVSTMLVDGMKKIAGKESLQNAWDALFKNFNEKHGKGTVGYASGEKVVIKINLTTMGSGGRHFNSAMNATPQLCFALLQQLVDSLNIDESDITFGDPFRGMPDEIFNLCHDEYPNIHYIEGDGGDGREKTVIGSDDVYFNSDDNFQSRLPQAYLDASYLINMPCLKTHNSAGITIAAKNHQGSVIGPDQVASNQSMINYLHYDYPVDGGPSNQVMGKYRHIVDYIAHNKLGGNTLIYIVDAIWSGRNWDAQVDKFQMAPFNNDWTSSLFISQDPVALESVGFDFLYNEYKNYPKSHGNANYPLVSGVQDYIHQAADPANWAAGIAYDPSSPNHTAPVSSLGVHEHWNNMTDKQYNRNLGNSTGIQLVGVPASLVAGSTTSINSHSMSTDNSLKVYPNPVKNFTSLNYSLSSNATVHLEVISLQGKVVWTSSDIRQEAGSNVIQWNVKEAQIPQGTYLCKVVAEGSTLNIFTSKVSVIK
ncbi:MAG: DUF362 domain-containing protein [Prolixibacteraceae bacterium]